MPTVTLGGMRTATSVLRRLLPTLLLLGALLAWLLASGALDDPEPAEIGHAGGGVPAPIGGAQMGPQLQGSTPPREPEERTVRVSAYAPGEATTIVEGRVLRGGLPVAGRWVSALSLEHGVDPNADPLAGAVQTDAEGRYRLLLRSARHAFYVGRIGARPPLHEVTAQPIDAVLVQTTLVPAQSEPLALDLELPTGSLRVSVRDAETHRPIEGAVVTLVLRVSVRDAEVPLFESERPTSMRGEVLFEDLEQGRAEIVAARANHEPSALHEAAVGRDEAQVEILLEPRATLVLRIIDAETAEVLPISHDLRPYVGHVDGDSGAVAEAGPWLPETRRPGSLIYRNRPGGPHVVRLEDTAFDLDEGAGVRFLPVSAAGESRVELTLRETTTFDLPVQYRSYALLRGLRGDGKVDRDLTLHVFEVGSGATRRVLPASWQRGDRHGDWHFDGYLERGTYRIVLTRADGRSWEETLIVDEARLQREFASPWGD